MDRKNFSGPAYIADVEFGRRGSTFSRRRKMPGTVIEAASEWVAAGAIQQQFMKEAPRESDYSARCRQAGEVRGDFYTCLPAPGDSFAFAVGDASGKGLSAALIMASVQASLRTAISLTGGDGRAALAAVNREIYESSPADRYATLFHAVFEPATRTLRYVNAGHNPPLVLRRDSPALWLETGGAPVGMFPDWKYEEGAVQLHTVISSSRIRMAQLIPWCWETRNRFRPSTRIANRRSFSSSQSLRSQPKRIF
jgi:serine phosphatase RsbU (regulator of sigma subunit)